MLTSYNRYTFKPHHFILAHDVVLDSVELNAETYDDDNFECNKENDAQFTWDFPVNSSNLFHSSNTSLESLNMKNAVRSKLGGSAKSPLHEQIKRHKADAMETMCSLRIEDFAKIGTNCVRLNLDSVISRKNLKKQPAARSATRPDWSHQEQLDRTNESTAGHKRNASVNRDASSGSSYRVSRRLPETPNTPMRDTAYQLSRDPVPVSSLIRTPSLAEELKAALMAENPEHSDKDPGALRSSLPDGFRLNLSLRSGEESPDFSVDLSELGSPEQIDPVNKYGGGFFFFDEFAAKEKRPPCRKSCCISDTDSDTHRPATAKDKQDVTMSLGIKTARKERGEVVSHRNTPEIADRDLYARLVKTDRSDEAVRNSDDAGTDSDLRLTSYNLGSGKDCLVNKVGIEEEKCYKNSDNIHQNNTCKALVKKFPPTTSVTGDVVCMSVDFNIDEIDATHRGCHKFVPRHQEELAIEIGDYIYVQVEDDDLWCEGVNLRTRQSGIFPAAYAMDLSLFDDDSHNSKFFVKYLGSIEVGFHKGNDVLCQAINKLAAARQKTADSNPLPLCCLEITEHGVKMTDRSAQAKAKVASVSGQLKAKLRSSVEQGSSENDHLFLLKNISFCGYHPKNDRYFGFITKHPLEMRFACHVFQNDKSSTVIAEAIRDAFRKFYQEYLAYIYPTEDIYLE